MPFAGRIQLLPLEPNDVVLAEVGPALHLNDDQRLILVVHNPMGLANCDKAGRAA